MSAQIVVLYPPGKFDIDYYLEKHMPIAMKQWGPHGFKSYKIITFAEGSPYTTQCTMFWDSHEAFDKGVGSPEAKEVFDDLPNFTDTKPVLMKAVHRGEM